MAVRMRSLPWGWYPDSESECRREIAGFLTDFTPPPGPWKGGVAPHAGWYYSGKAAARVINTLAVSPRPDRVVVYGGHLSGNHSPIVYQEDAWETPLGLQPLDGASAAALVAGGHATAAGRSFSDNTVEVQLPFIRAFFPEVPLIAVHSPASQGAVRLAEAVRVLLQEKGLSAVFIGSADLTHYGANYGFAPKGTGKEAVRWVKEENDRSIIDKALAMDAPGLLRDAETRNNTCSAGSMAAVIASVAGYGVQSGKLLEYYTSYDISPGAGFVGYAAIVY